jgi:hypothetical protein
MGIPTWPSGMRHGPYPLITVTLQRKGGASQSVSKHEKECLKYCDYYSFMSYSDFIKWVEADDRPDPEMSSSSSDRPD